MAKDAKTIGIHDYLVIGEAMPLDMDNPTTLIMDHNELGDGRRNLGVTTTTFDTINVGENSIKFGAGYIAKIGTLPSSIDVEDACVP